PTLGHQEHLPDVVMLGLAVGLAEDPILAWDSPVTVAPQRGDEVDPADDRPLLARPVARDQPDGLGPPCVEGRVVEDHGAAGLHAPRFGLFPELSGVGLEPVEGVVRGCEGGARLHPRGFRTTDRAGRGDVEIDEVVGWAAWWVHRAIVAHMHTPGKLNFC